jgi:hypothetical protein
MKKIGLLFMLLTLAAGVTAQTFPLRRIQDLREQRRDSLLVKWNASPFGARNAQGVPNGFTDGDTVRIVCQVYWQDDQSFSTTDGRLLLYVADTGRVNGSVPNFGGLAISDIVTGPPVDSSLSVSRGGPQVGDIIRLTARVRQPFGSPAGYFETQQLDKLNTISFDYVNFAQPLATPPTITLDSLLNPDGTIRMEIGDRYDGMLVRIVPSSGQTLSTVVSSQTIGPNGRYSTWFVQSGTQRLAIGDDSKFLRLAGTGGGVAVPDSIPQNGLSVLSVTGVIGKVALSGLPDNGSQGYTGNGRTYRVHLRRASDVVISGAPIAPLIAGIGRTGNPLAATPNQAITLNLRVRELNPLPATVQSVQVFYNTTSTTPTANFGGPYTTVAATRVNDTLFTASLPASPEGTFFNYLVRATSSTGSTRLFPDTVNNADRFRLLFRVSANPGIRDIQFTPYIDARSPLINTPVTVSGRITADTTSRIYGSYRSLFIQDARASWSGVQVITPQFSTARIGQQVSVVGTVVETEILGAASDLSIVNSNAMTSIDTRSGGSVTVTDPTLVPFAPLDTTTSVLQTNSEPFEGVLIQVRNAVVTNNAPGFADFQIGNDTTGFYLVDDLSGPEFRGLNAGGPPVNPLARLVFRGDTFQSVRGIHFFGRNAFRLTPRATGDFTGYFSSVEKVSDTRPTAFALAQNYPNPFNPSTTINYQLSTTSNVKLEIFDLLGRKVATLVNERQTVGAYTANFNAAQLSSGVYFYRLQAGSFVQTKKMMLIK